MTDRFVGFALRKIGAAPAVRPHSRKQVGSDSNVAGFSDLIGEILHPIGHTKDFVNDEDDRRLTLRLRINDKCFDRAAIVFDANPFAMARRLFQLGLGPILRRNSVRGEQEKNQCDVFHGCGASRAQGLEFITESVHCARSAKTSLGLINFIPRESRPTPHPRCFAERVRKRLKTKERNYQKSAKSEKESAST